MAKKGKIITMRFSEKEVQLLEALKKAHYDEGKSYRDYTTTQFFKRLMKHEALKYVDKIPPKLLP